MPADQDSTDEERADRIADLATSHGLRVAVAESLTEDGSRRSSARRRGRQRVVPRCGRGLRRGGEVRGAGRHPRSRRHGCLCTADGGTAYAGCWAPTSRSASPGWAGPALRRTGRPARSTSRWPRSEAPASCTPVWTATPPRSSSLRRAWRSASSVRRARRTGRRAARRPGEPAESVDGAAEMASTSRPALSSGRFLAMSAWLIMPTRSCPSMTGRRLTPWRAIGVERLLDVVVRPDGDDLVTGVVLHLDLRGVHALGHAAQDDVAVGDHPLQAVVVAADGQRADAQVLHLAGGVCHGVVDRGALGAAVIASRAVVMSFSSRRGAVWAVPVPPATATIRRPVVRTWGALDVWNES